MRYYNEMPLKILKAEELVGGEEAMDQILYQLFNREVDPMYPYLTEQEFLDACGLTEDDLNLDQNLFLRIKKASLESIFCWYPGRYSIYRMADLKSGNAFRNRTDGSLFCAKFL